MNTFLHVGYTKCASSFLRQHYFIRENGFYEIKVNRLWRNFLYHQLCAAQTSYYDSAHPPLPDSQLFKNFNVGLSAEGFVCGDSIDYALALSRYKAIFPDTKVLVIVRNQPDLIFSHYIQMVKMGYSRNIDSHLKEIMWNSQQSIWGTLNFAEVYEITKNIFDDVLLLPYEDIWEYEHFIGQLNNFFEKDFMPVNVKVNVSWGDNTVAVGRILNKFFTHGVQTPYQTILPSYVIGGGRFEANDLAWRKPSANASRNIRLWSSRIGKRLPIAAKSSRDQFRHKYKSLFEDHFSDSNRNIDKLLNLQLEKHGYVGASNSSHYKRSQ